MFIGGMFMLMGGLFTTILAVVFLQSLSMRGWQQVPAELLDSKVDVLDGGSRLDEPFRLSASFRYQIDGTVHTGHRVRLNEATSRNFEELALQRAGLVEADPLMAYVDPANPADAVLFRESLWTGLFMLFPLVFVIIGVFLFRSGWRARKKAGSASQGGTESLAAAATKAEQSRKLGPWVGFAFFTVFAGIGIGILFPLLINPWRMAKNAEGWAETPAEVIWSRVITNRSSDSTTYGIDIFYRYEFDGVEHKSNRYNFVSGTSSGYAPKKAVVDRFPPGHQFTCFVDPDRPERAVIDREGGIGFWFLIPLTFAAVGLTGMIGFGVALVRSRITGGPGSFASQFGGGSSPFRDSAESEGPAQVELQAGAKRRAALFSTLGIAVFWNGIVSVFLFVGASDDTSILLYLFLIPFLLIGLVLIGSALYCFIGFFNPRTDLLLRPGHPRLGATSVLRWRTRGSLGRLRDLRITIECVEKASYSRGTNRVTDEAIIFRQTLADLRPGLEVREGRVDLNLPEALVPTWDGGSNKIEWRLHVTGEIKPGPDVNETHPVTVLAPSIARS